MSLWRQVSRGLRSLLRPAAADRDVSDEVEHYLEQAVASLVARGLSPEAARRAARLELGNAAGIREHVRASGWENLVGRSVADARYAGRQLRNNPGFAVTTILIVGLGIGSAAATFSVVNPILFEPLPFPHAERLTLVRERRGGGGRMTNFATYRGIVERSRSFAAIAVLKAWQPTMTGTAAAERLEGQRVSSSYFRALGVHPTLGRDFESIDDLYHGPNVVILSHHVWQSRFAADPAVVGRTVRLDDNSFTVVGVMPRDFENVLAPEAEVWAPLQYNPALPIDGREWGHHLQMIARLHAGTSREQARQDLDAIGRRLKPAYAPGYAVSGGAPDGFLVHSLQADITADARPALIAVLGAVALVLVIACVNVANLLLARGVRRRGELAMRLALGAGRVRLIRQLLTESLLLAALGGGVGMVVAEAGVRALLALSPPDLPRLHAVAVDGVVLAFALCATTFVGIVAGLMPALVVSRADLRAGIQGETRRTAGGQQWIRRTLVMAEVAATVVLLVSAGLLLRSIERLFAVPVGFEPSHLLTMQVQETGRRFDTNIARHRFFEQALEAVRRVPGVSAAGFTSQLPLSGDDDVYGMQFEKDGDPGGPALRYAVTPGYLDAMHIPLRRGRSLDAHDTADTPRVVLINESFARREFAGRDPIGQRVRMGADMGRRDRPWSTIVGVVGDVKQTSLAVGAEDAFYVPATQWPFADSVLSLVVRTEGDAAAIAPTIRQAIWSVDKDQPIARVATMVHLVGASEARRRFALIVFAAFAFAGLLLAATGVYGVVSGSVTERTREIGIRRALGASRASILSVVMMQGLTLTGLGVVAGIAGAVPATRAIATMLFGISRLDAATYAGVIGLLGVVSAMACWVPAWRAARVDPAVTLRAE